MKLETSNGTIVSLRDSTREAPGDFWPSRDPGIPLESYAELPVDPLKIWKTQHSVRKVVGFAARQCAGLPWHAYQRVSDTDRQRLKDSPAEQAFAHPADVSSRDGFHPSDLVSGYMLLESLFIDRMLYDRCLALLIDGQPTRIPPKRWRVKSDWLGRPRRIMLLTPAGEEDLDITGMAMAVSWGWGDSAAGGVSPMFTLAQTIEESRQSVEWRLNQWRGSHKFTGLLRHPTTFKDAIKKKQFIESWRDWSTGREGTPILEEGMELVEPPKINPKDIRDIEGRQLTDVEVASAFHIPPELVGARPGNFSNMQAFRSMLYGPTLGPMITDLTQAINGLVPFLDARPGVYLEANREAAINGSLIEQAQVLQTMTGTPVMAVAEARSRLNLPYKEGTDELVVPLNVLVGGQASPTDSGAQNRGGPAAAGAPSGATAAAASAPVSDVASMKTAFDAIGVAVRSGVKPAAAAEKLGMSDLQFVDGFLPVTIRVPGEDEPTAEPSTPSEDEQ